MRVLLLVDDEEDLQPLFRRILRRDFDTIHVATSISEAETVLGSVPVTHLVVDSVLSRHERVTPEFIETWRKSTPTLEFVGMFSGSSQAKQFEGTPGLDGVFLKPNGFDDLLNRLRRPKP